MMHGFRQLIAARLLAAFAIASVFPLAVSGAAGQQAVPTDTTASNAGADQLHSSQKVARPYAIEFRARSAHNYGHTFSVHGRVNANGRFTNPKVAGLHPATESPVPWMIGHVVAVPSETGASDGDLEDQYVIARFRVALTESEYRKVAGYIKQLSDKSPVWHAVVYNCNAFIGDIAKYMGLETPYSTMLMPQEYIDKLRDMNVSRTDRAKVIGVPVKVQDAAALRAAALKTVGQRKKTPQGSAQARPTVTASPTTSQ